jgi:hypothetical protein
MARRMPLPGENRMKDGEEAGSNETAGWTGTGRLRERLGQQ